MIVPQYWAEARTQARQGRRQVTVRRFGWSDDSRAAAEAHAQQRVEQALAAILAGDDLPRRERRATYGEGVPIREEIIERSGDVVLTRNGYGALCLNVPDVVFADIDFEPPPQRGLPGVVLAVLLVVVALAVGTATTWWLGWLAAIAVVWSAQRGARELRAARHRAAGSPEQQARARIDAFVDRHRDWHLRIYRTPAGMRVLVMHACFTPDAPEVKACFDALGVDPVFARLCRMQHCFRARVSPKPWRIGIGGGIRPRLTAEHDDLHTSPERRSWVQEYERRSRDFAACRHVGSVGDLGATTAQTRRIADWHDALCRAEGSLPLA